MAMPITVPRYTLADLDRFPSDGNRYELLGGVLLVSPSPALPHQVVTARLVMLLGDLLRPWPDLMVATPGALVRPPDTRLEPDILVFRAPTPATRWETVTEHLLAVEVASPSTAIYDRDFKRPAYLDLGVAEVWRVDLGSRAILVSRPGQPPDVAHLVNVVWTPPGIDGSLPIAIPPLFDRLG